MRRLVMLTLSLAVMLTLPSLTGIAIGAKPKCNGFVATKVGTDRSQVIRGTDRRDVILAKGGADRIFAGKGNDIICAGPGNDLVDGGDGKDRIDGSGGNDTLRGGPGRDVLDGSNGNDACYPASGGDKILRCEPADLAVTIMSPVSVDAGLPVELTVRVTNAGSTRSGPFDLQLLMTQTTVVCAEDLTGTTPSQAVWPKAFVELVFSIEAGCQMQPGADQHITISATMLTDGLDDDSTNDQAAARIDIRPAAIVPPP